MREVSWQDLNNGLPCNCTPCCDKRLKNGFPAKVDIFGGPHDGASGTWPLAPDSPDDAKNTWERVQKAYGGPFIKHLVAKVYELDGIGKPAPAEIDIMEITRQIVGGS